MGLELEEEGLRQASCSCEYKYIYSVSIYLPSGADDTLPGKAF